MEPWIRKVRPAGPFFGIEFSHLFWHVFFAAFSDFLSISRSILASFSGLLASFFHYRSIDVSTIKELARRWNPEIIDSAPKKTGGHRALDDIRESVAELLHYRKNLFINK